MKDTATKRIYFLDYLRIIAFLSVLIGHKFLSSLDFAMNSPDIHTNIRMLLSVFRNFILGGGFGVVIFFLISGYIIPATVNNSVKGFLIKRFFRIYPLYILAIVLQTIIGQLLTTNTISFSPAIIDYKTLFFQLTLLGDFNNTTYSLNGVEWTLRVEVTFYIIVAILGYFGFMDKRINYLYYVLWLLLALTFSVAPIPVELFSSYLTTYLPFIFIGVCFWLLEKKVISIKQLFLYMFTVFVYYSYMLSKYNPSWLETHFAALGLIFFSICYYYRDKFKPSRKVFVLSAMTYPVYLCHNWLFDYIIRFTDLTSVYLINGILASLALLLFAFFLNKYVEEPAIKIGKILAGDKKLLEKSFSLKLMKIKFIKFTMVGVINTIISLIVYWILLKLSVHYLVSSAVAYITGILFSYLLNSKFVFKNSDHSINKGVAFGTTYLSSLCINLALMYVFVSLFKLDQLVSQIGVIIIITFYNYYLCNNFVFKKKSNNLQMQKIYFDKNLYWFVIFLVLPLVFYYNFWGNSAYWANGDGLTSYLNIKNLWANKVKAGEDLFWNQYFNSGYPFFADIQNAVLYPLNLIFLILPLKYAYNYSLLLHFSLAGFFTFLFLRQINITKFSALIGALAVMFSPSLNIRVGHFTIVACIIWFPLILYFIEKRVAENSIRYLVFSAITFSIQVSAGFIQIAFYSGVFASIYLLFRYDFNIRKTLKDLAIFGSLTLLICSPQIIPLFELTKFVGKDKITYEYFSMLSMPLSNIFTYFLPYIFGDNKNVYNETNIPYFNKGAMLGENDVYSGVVIFIIAAFGAYYFLKKDKKIKFWVFAFLGSLIFVLGSNISFISKIFYHIPVFNWFRIPVRAIFINNFALVTLFCLSLDKIGSFSPAEFRKFWIYIFIFTFFSFVCLVMILLRFDNIFINKLALGITLFDDVHIKNLQNYLSFSNVWLYSGIFIALTLALSAFFLKNNSRSDFNHFKTILFLVLAAELWVFSFGINKNFYRNIDFETTLVNQLKTEEKDKYRVLPLMANAVKRHAGIDNGIYSNISMFNRISTVNNHITFGKKHYMNRLSIDPAGVSTNLLKTISDNKFLSELNTKYIITDTELAHNIKNQSEIKPISAKLIFSDEMFNISKNTVGVFSVYSASLPIKARKYYSIELKLDKPAKDYLAIDFYGGTEYDKVEQDILLTAERNSLETYKSLIYSGDTIPSKVNFRIISKDHDLIIKKVTVSELTVTGKKLYKEIFDDGKYTIFENPNVKEKIFSTDNIDFSPKIPEITMIKGKVISLENIGKAIISNIKYSSGKSSANSECLQEKCFVVFSENYYPGWNVKVNKTTADIYVYDHLIQGAFVPKGKNTIEFYYVPNYLKLSFLLFIFGISISIYLIFRKQKQ